MHELRSLRDLLLVEDDPDHAELTREALTDAGVCNPIVTVDSVAHALDYLEGRGKFAGRNRKGAPCVILLDLRLPDGSGFDVLRAVRGHATYGAVPVVVLTTSANGPDVQQAYALGANSYLVKPVGYEEFHNKVREAGLYWALLNQVPTF
jgi:CheY-like chemotaxis protein